MSIPFEKTLAGRCEVEKTGCDELGFKDLWYVFNNAVDRFNNKEYKAGRRLFDVAVFEYQRRLDLRLGRVPASVHVGTQSLLEELGVKVEGIEPLYNKAVTVTKTTKPAKSQPVVTLPLPGVPKKRGRPPTGKALSLAERQANFRAKQKKLEQYRLEAAAQSFEKETDEELYSWLATSGPVLQEKAWIELGRRKGWKMPLL